jgi:hypothetical protein
MASDRKLLTDKVPGLPNRHQWTPYWHPSGHHLLLTARKQEWSGLALFGNPDYEAVSGFGRHDDLWLIAADQSRSWKLTDDPNTFAAPSGRI